jgi:hypothetical protein
LESSGTGGFQLVTRHQVLGAVHGIGVLWERGFDDWLTTLHTTHQDSTKFPSILMALTDGQGVLKLTVMPGSHTTRHSPYNVDSSSPLYSLTKPQQVHLSIVSEPQEEFFRDTIPLEYQCLAWYVQCSSLLNVSDLSESLAWLAKQTVQNIVTLECDEAVIPYPILRSDEPVN